jgi:hypothetical protein
VAIRGHDTAHDLELSRQTVAVVTVGQARGHVNRYVISFSRQPPLTAFVPERGAQYVPKFDVASAAGFPGRYSSRNVGRDNHEPSISSFWNLGKGASILGLFIFNLSRLVRLLLLTLYTTTSLSIYRPLAIAHTF